MKCNIKRMISFGLCMYRPTQTQ